jgi:hypothetical protein
MLLSNDLCHRFSYLTCLCTELCLTSAIQGCQGSRPPLIIQYPGKCAFRFPRTISGHNGYLITTTN